MYNRYLPQDADAFDGLYRHVEEKPVHQSPPPPPPPKKEIKSGFLNLDFQSLLAKSGLEDIGLIPLLILAFLLVEADEEERLILIVLAVVLGI